MLFQLNYHQHLVKVTFLMPKKGFGFSGYSLLVAHIMQPLHVLLTHTAYIYSPEKYNYGCIWTKHVLCTWHVATPLYELPDISFHFLFWGKAEGENREENVWLGTADLPLHSFQSDRISARRYKVPLFACSVLGCYTYSHTAPAHLDHLGVSIVVRKKFYLQTCWFCSSVWGKWTLPEGGFWREQQNQHLTPTCSLWH